MVGIGPFTTVEFGLRIMSNDTGSLGEPISPPGAPLFVQFLVFVVFTRQENADFSSNLWNWLGGRMIRVLMI